MLKQIQKQHIQQYIKMLTTKQFTILQRWTRRQMRNPVKTDLQLLHVTLILVIHVLFRFFMWPSSRSANINQTTVTTSISYLSNN